MRIDGKQIAEDIREQIKNFVQSSGMTPEAAFVVVGENPVSERFVRAKERFAEYVGISTRRVVLSEDATNEQVSEEIRQCGNEKNIHAIIVQLPLPKHIDQEKILSVIPVEKDADVLSSNAMGRFRKGDSSILPPVAGAVQEILERMQVDVEGREVVVIGHGRLVGAPVALLMRHNLANVTVVDRPMKNLAEITQEADIIISGVGSPGLVTRSMVKQGAVLIDAGTTESGGMLVGDIDKECEDIASYSTPVPGGVGPITVAVLMKNIALLAKQAHTNTEDHVEF